MGKRASTRGSSLSAVSSSVDRWKASQKIGGWSITDRYIKDTRLRLPRMEPIHGGRHNLQARSEARAIRARLRPDRATLTNIYLSPSEYAVLAQLDAPNSTSAALHSSTTTASSGLVSSTLTRKGSFLPRSASRQPTT